MTEINRPPMTQAESDSHYREPIEPALNPDPQKGLTMADIRFEVYKHATPSIELHMEEILWQKRLRILGASVLDAASAGGAMHHRLQEAGYTGAYLAVDRNYTQFELPKKQTLNVSALFVGGDISKLPFNQGQLFDTEYLNMVLYHLTEDQRSQAYQQSQWAVKPSGVIVPSTSGKNNKKVQRELEYEIADSLHTRMGEEFGPPPIMNEGWTIETADDELHDHYQGYNIHKFVQHGQFIIDSAIKARVSTNSIRTAYKLYHPVPPEAEFRVVLTELEKQMLQRYQAGKPYTDTIHRAFYFVTKQKLPLQRETALTEPTVIPKQREIS